MHPQFKNDLDKRVTSLREVVHEQLATNQEKLDCLENLVKQFMAEKSSKSHRSHQGLLEMLMFMMLDIFDVFLRLNFYYVI